MIEDKVSELGKIMHRHYTVSSFIRDCVFQVLERPDQLHRDLQEITYQIRKISVNVNLIQKRCEEDAMMLTDLLRLHNAAREMESLLEKMKEREECDGDHKDQ